MVSTDTGRKTEEDHPVSHTLIKLILGVVIFFTAFGVVGWRINKAPDILTDEILYSRLGIRVLEEGAVIWDHGSMTVIHPPYYFLLNGLFLGATGAPGAELYAPGDVFELVFHDRLFNVLIAAGTSLLLFMNGLRLRGVWLGIFITFLFIIDPFGVRINRRAMLETLAGLFSLLGLLILLTGFNKKRSLGYGILAGMFFGAGILVKELAFILPLAVGIFGLWEFFRKRGNWRTALTSSGIAFASYLIFPIWVIYTGNWIRFVNVKTLALERLVGLVHTSGWNRPGVSFVDFVLNRLLDYGSSYLILLLGGLATLVLIIRRRDESMGRILGVWGILIYPFYAFITFFGSGNDQFFYFLLLPSIIILGYTLIERDDPGLSRLVSRIINLFRNQPRALYRMRDKGSALFLAAAIIILIIILPFNVFSWISNFGVGVDTGYQQLSNFIRSNIPPGTPINASGDSLKYTYFLPHHPVADAADPLEASEVGVNYFVIVPKDIQAKFGNISEEFARWIIANGQLIFSTRGETYGDIFLYHVPNVGEPTGEPLPGSGDSGFQRSFPEAETGFIGSLLLIMAIWYLLCIWLFIASVRKSLAEPKYAMPTSSGYQFGEDG